MTDQIGRADYVLGTDISGVKAGTAEAEAEILKSGERTEAAAKSRAERVGNVIGTGIKIAAGAATAMFAIASKGAIELQNVTADFTAETGLAGAAADRAGKAINEMSGRNIQGIKEIGGALTKVHTDMGLVGDEAEKTTEQFLKFARATKQDATGAVIAFDNILDAWGLTAKDATGIMDKLILSHQRYGGSIVENQKALATMAPQLKALNLTIDDGIGLLNLFASTGLDAAGAQKTLNAAISNLPPGETLQQFIAHLATIVDDGQRAQEAMKVFGTRAGAGLANAIRPGVDSLKALEVSATDAAGATVKTADAMDSTFSSQIQLKINAVGAAIRDIGPGITGVASALSLIGSFASVLKLDDLFKGALPGLLNAAKSAGSQAGSALSDGLQSVWSGAGGTVIGNNIASRIENIFADGETVIGRGWRKIIGSAPAKAAIGAAGAAGGLIYGVAAGATEKLVGPIMGAWAAVGGSGAILGEARAAGALAGGAYGIAFQAALVVGVAAIAQQISGPINKQGRDLHEIIFSKDGPLGFLKEPLEGVGQWLDSLPWPLGPVGAPDWAGGSSDVKAGMATIGAAMDEARTEWVRDHAVAAAATAKLTDGMANDLRNIPPGFHRAAVSATSMAIDISDAGLKSRNSLSTLRDAAISDVQDMIDKAFDPAIKHDEMWATARELAAQRAIVASKTSTAAQKRDAADLVTTLQKRLLEEKVELLKMGALSSKEQAALVTDLKGQIKNATGPTKTYLQGVLDKILEIEKVGKIIPINFKVANTTGIFKEDHKAAGGPIEPDDLYKVGEHGEEWFVSKKAGEILRNGVSPASLMRPPAAAAWSGPPPAAVVQAQIAAAPQQVHYHYEPNVQVQGLVRARDPFEIATQLRRLAQFATLSPQRALR